MIELTQKEILSYPKKVGVIYFFDKNHMNGVVSGEIVNIIECIKSYTIEVSDTWGELVVYIPYENCFYTKEESMIAYNIEFNKQKLEKLGRVESQKDVFKLLYSYCESKLDKCEKEAIKDMVYKYFGISLEPKFRYLENGIGKEEN